MSIQQIVVTGGIPEKGTADMLPYVAAFTGVNKSVDSGD